MPFAEEELRFPAYYPNPALLEEMRKSDGIAPPQKVRAIMGDLVFPAAPADRPYLYGCMVLSFDGKMGYHDNPEGHLISKANAFDPAGATADFWGWNVCRTYADAVILGCGTLWARIDKPWSAEIVDGDLIAARSELKKRTAQPLSMIATLDGTDVPLKHAILDMRPKPVILTSRKGAEYLARQIGREHRVFDKACDLFRDDGVIKILAAGEEKPDTPALLKLLRQSGIGYVSVEAPGYIWNLINERLLDEFLLNYSGVMVGGTHILGAKAPYTVERHPHVALLSVGYHKGFLYTRQKLLYE